jgi:YesN/AraC family two-component response regulator
MSHKLLFVDDEENVLASLKRLFFKHDYEIYMASGGREALKLIDEAKPDLIISDQRMPEMTGAEFLSKSREILPDSIRMVLTGYADIDAAIAAINEGKVYKFIMKPWDKDDLILSVEKALEHYDLIKENKRLHEELKEWNRTLEQKVKDRTRELQEEKDKIVTVINTIREGFLYCDENAILLHINPGAEKYFNIKFKDVVCKPLEDNVFDPIRDSVKKYLVKFNEDRQQKEIEGNFKLKNGEWYNIRFLPVREAKNDKFLGLIMQLFTIKERYL